MTGALKDVVSHFWNDDKMTPESAMSNMVNATSSR
jgi:hypothetical protein